MSKVDQKESKHFRQGFFLIILIAITILFIFVIRKFIMPMLLAAIAAGLFGGLHARINKLMPKMRWLSSMLSVLVVVVTILLPLGLIGYLVLDDVMSYTKAMSENIAEVRQLAADLINTFGSSDLLSFFGITVESLTADFEEMMQKIGNEFVSWTVNFSRNLLTTLFFLFIFLYTLYFFFKDGKRILDDILDLIPMRGKDKDHIAGQFVSVTRATIKGTLLVGLIHGVFGCLLLLVLGVKAPVLWGVIMTILSVIPAIGPIVVYIPMGIVLIIQGFAFKGILIIILGIAIVAVADYILRPKFIGDDAKIPQLLILFGVLGGLMLFGIFGFIIGPIVMAIFITTWNIYAKTFKRELAYADTEPEYVEPKPKVRKTVRKKRGKN